MTIVEGGSHSSVFSEETWVRELEFFGQVPAK